MARKTPTSNPKRRTRKFARCNDIESNDLQATGQRSRGRRFLKDLVAKREKDEAEGTIDDGICTAVLAKAFDNGPPNKYSALALEMFIVQKCYGEGCGESTADGISSAFAALWDRDGEIYAGEYSYNEETGEVKGNPARSINVKAVVHSVKAREKSKGGSATRNHAEAMTLEELQRLMQWSTQECPNEWLTDDGWRSEVHDAIAALKHRLQHGFMRGFMPSAFTLLEFAGASSY